MECGKCGRNLPPKRTSCMYCGGAPKAEAAPARTGPLSCPACRSAMEEVDEHGIVIDRCTACHGVWYDLTELEATVEAKKTAPKPAANSLWDHLPSAEAPAPSAAPASVEPTAVKYHPCPICQRSMHRQSYKKVSGVIANVCAEHGVYLDAGRIEQIVQFEQNPPPPAEPEPKQPQMHGHQRVAPFEDQRGSLLGGVAGEIAIEAAAFAIFSLFE